MERVIKKYEEGYDGSEVFQEYETGLQALLSAYSAASPAEHFKLPEKDASKLVQVTGSSFHAMPEVTLLKRNNVIGAQVIQQKGNT